MLLPRVSQQTSRALGTRIASQRKEPWLLYEPYAYREERILSQKTHPVIL
jgi:hypothetical protein